MTEPQESTAPPGAEILKRAVVAWRKAQVVYQSPSWEGQPTARAFAEEVALRRECEQSLWELLADPDRLVVAYALLALELMGSEKLADLPDTLLADRSNISLQLGSFRNGMDLGGFARQIRKQAAAVAEERLGVVP